MLTELSAVSGVRGTAVVTPDGIMVASSLHGRFDEDVVAGLASFLIATTNRSMSDEGGFERFVMHSTHGKVVLNDLGESFLVTITDQFVTIDPLLAEIDDCSRRLRRATKLGA